MEFASHTYKERLYEAALTHSYHCVLEILSILQTIEPISYNEDSTIAFNQLYRGSVVGRMAERSKALV